MAARFNPADLCIVVIQLHTNCSPEGWKPDASLSAPGIEPGPPVYMNEHVLERLTPQPTELANQTICSDKRSPMLCNSEHSPSITLDSYLKHS